MKMVMSKLVALVVLVVLVSVSASAFADLETTQVLTWEQFLEEGVIHGHDFDRDWTALRIPRKGATELAQLELVGEIPAEFVITGVGNHSVMVAQNGIAPDGVYNKGSHNGQLYTCNHKNAIEKTSRKVGYEIAFEMNAKNVKVIRLVAITWLEDGIRFYGVRPCGTKMSKAPTQESKAPVQETKVPVQETKVPAQETKVPAQVTETPTQETKVPAQVTEAPVQETKAPAQVTETPTQETKAPAQVTEAPVQEIPEVTLVAPAPEVTLVAPAPEVTLVAPEAPAAPVEVETNHNVETSHTAQETTEVPEVSLVAVSAPTVVEEPQAQPEVISAPAAENTGARETEGFSEEV